MSTAQAPAGWYPDGAGHLRWWDGAQWSAHFAPLPAGTGTSQSPIASDASARAARKAQKRTAKADAHRANAERKREAAREKAAATTARADARAEQQLRAKMDALPPTTRPVEMALREAVFGTRGGQLKLTEFPLWGKQWPNTEVAGESHHRDSLAALYRPRGRFPGTEFFTTAHLVPEITAEHPDAVRVEVEGHIVGYLAHADGIRYRPVVAKLAVDGLVPTVQARVWARDDDGTWRGRVTIALDAPATVAPANPHPGASVVELPEGRTVKVIGGEARAAVLAPLVRAGHKVAIWVTLHAVTIATPRAEKRLVEAHVNGTTVGRLTPVTSADVLRVLDLADAEGRTIAAHGYLTGNSLSTELALSIARSTDLAESWIQDNLASNA